jgi:acyl carrier protein
MAEGIDEQDLVRELARYLETEILNNSLGREIEPHEDLLGTEMVDSMGMLRFIGHLEDRFKIHVLPEDQVIENFMNVECIVQYIQKKQSKPAG